jgi:hypothetical protein
LGAGTEYAVEAVNDGGWSSAARSQQQQNGAQRISDGGRPDCTDRSTRLGRPDQDNHEELSKILAMAQVVNFLSMASKDDADRGTGP